MDRIASTGFFLWLRRRRASEGWGHVLRTWCFSSSFFFFWPHLPADVPCNVVAALPVPLGQRVCDSAVPGHFLRHHPAAPWSEARSNHRPHDRWVSSSLLWLPEGFHLQQAGFKWPAVWMITHLYKTLFKLNQAIVSMFLYWQPVN